MGIDDIVDKGKDLLGDAKQKAEAALGSEKVEKATDAVLDGAANLAKKITPDKADETIDKLRDKADDAL